MTAERVSGAVMGALIGDALGLGCHWYYDLAALRHDHGPWISGYTTPRPERYHGGMRPGQLSQSGLILVMLLQSLVEQGGYVEDDFTCRLDEELFPLRVIDELENGQELLMLARKLEALTNEH